MGVEEEALPEIIDLTGEEIKPEKEPRIVEFQKKREARARAKCYPDTSIKKKCRDLMPLHWKQDSPTLAPS